MISGSPIHAIIETDYAATHRVGKVILELPVIGGSKTGLPLKKVGEVDEPGFFAKLVGNPTGNVGRIDITDVVGDWGAIYEIKDEKESIRGWAEITYYMQTYNENPTPGGPTSVGLGVTYHQVWKVIGIDPSNAGQYLMAKLYAPGVIVYKRVKKEDAKPLPTYVWEYDPQTKSVQKRQLALAWVPVPVDCPVRIDPKTGAITISTAGMLLFVWYAAKVAAPLCGPGAPLCAWAF